MTRSAPAHTVSSRQEPKASATVLVVDDDPGVARKLAEMTRDAGHQAVVANNWTDALRRFQGGMVDLVLMDAVLPGVDGFKLAQLLRQASPSYVPIVFVTGLEDRRTRELCIRAGADDLLTKPVRAEELELRLTAMLRIRQLTLDLAREGEALERLALVDPLTGVGNRRAFDEAIASELVRARRYEHPLCLIVGDIDHFKAVNDTHGHAAGDEVLRRFGALLRERVRPPEVPYRYGGEEFVVIAPELDVRAGLALADRLREAFAALSQDLVGGPMTVSFGVCDTDQLPRDADERLLFAVADRALYAAKQGGRNRVEAAEATSRSTQTAA